MISTLKAEVRKIFTVRPTYAMLGVGFGLVILLGFYVTGWHSDPADLLNPNNFAMHIRNAVNVVSLFVGLTAVLLMANEYRHNTIMYSLTLSNSRTKVLLSKILAITGLALVAAAVVMVIAPITMKLGLQANHVHYVTQVINYHDLIWRCLFYAWGYAMAGLLIATLVRNQIGAIIILLIVPGTFEQLLGIILKKNVVYLPFTALNTVSGVGDAAAKPAAITPFHAALVFSTYLIVGWLIAWTLFLRRDAN